MGNRHSRAARRGSRESVCTEWPRLVLDYWGGNNGNHGNHGIGGKEVVPYDQWDRLRSCDLKIVYIPKQGHLLSVRALTSAL